MRRGAEPPTRNPERTKSYPRSAAEPNVTAINRLAGQKVSLELDRDEVGDPSAGRTAPRRRLRYSTTCGAKSDAVTAPPVAPQRGVTV
jgi:hypothetical protein